MAEELLGTAAGACGKEATLAPLVQQIIQTAVAQAACGAVLASLIAQPSGRQLTALVAAAARGAVQGAICGNEVQQPPQADIVKTVQEVIDIVADSTPCGRNITEVKKSLRARGPEGAGLAARLSRASKARNALVHQDTQLVHHVQAVLQETGVQAMLDDVQQQ